MTINELIDKLNTYCKDNNVYITDYFDGEIWNELEKLQCFKDIEIAKIKNAHFIGEAYEKRRFYL